MENEYHPDVTVQSHGTLFLFHLLTNKARTWVDQNTLDDSTFVDGALVVEHRYADEISEAMVADGLTLSCLEAVDPAEPTSCGDKRPSLLRAMLPIVAVILVVIVIAATTSFHITGGQ